MENQSKRRCSVQDIFFGMVLIVSLGSIIYFVFFSSNDDSSATAGSNPASIAINPPSNPYQGNVQLDAEIDARIALNADPFYQKCQKAGGTYAPAKYSADGLYYILIQSAPAHSFDASCTINMISTTRSSTVTKQTVLYP